MNQLVGKKPEHEAIYSEVKELILFGEVAPGQPLTIHGLANLIGAGVTPVREAIRRLTAEGALESLENRRVAVPKMTVEKLQQIQLVRLSVEPALAEFGAKKCSKSDFSELERLDGLVDQAIQNGDIRRYLEANYRFHFTLYEKADAQILQRITESLWLQIGPSLRVNCGRFGTSNLVDQHQEAISALRNGDMDGVKQAFEGDIQQGMDFVQQALDE